MATLYWYGGTGNWSDFTNHWSLNSGNSPAAPASAAPTSTDDVVFNAASAAAGYTVTVNATSNCRNITMGQPASGNFQLSGTFVLNVFGNYDRALGVLLATNGRFTFKATSGIATIKSGGNTLGGGTYVFDGVGGTFQLLDDLILNGGLTLTNGNFDPNGKKVTLYAQGVNQAITGGFTFFDLQLTGGAIGTKTTVRTIASDITVTGTMSSTQGSSINRILIQSSTKGVPKTITANAVNLSNVDLQDIIGAGAANWNISGITGNSGDCGGNSGITFTTPVTTNWVSGTTWSTATWSVRVPLPQDTATFTTAGTATITQDMPRIGSVDFSTSSGKTWTTTTACSIFGYIDLTNLAALTADTATYTFEGRGNFSINNGGFTWQKSITIDAPGGTYKLVANFTAGVTRILTITNGTFTSVDGANNYVVSTGQFSIGAGGTFTPGSAIHQVTGTGAVWVMSGTISAGTYTLKFTDTSNSSITFGGGSRIYNNVWFSRGASTGSITISGSNTFNDFQDTGTVAHSLLFTTGTTQHVTTFPVSGSVGNLITINSTTTGTHSIVKDGGGVISSDFLNIQHSVVTPSNTWYAGNNSVNNQAVATAGSGWIFLVPPTDNFNFFFF